MGQHATIHGYDTTTAEEGKAGRWRPVRVDATGALVSSGASGYVEDTAHATGDSGTMTLAVRRDTEATSVSADGDYSSLSVDAQGNLRTRRIAGEDADVDATSAGLFGDYYATTTDTLIYNGPCVVLGFIVTVATAVGAINLTDSSTAGGTARYIVAAGAAAGTVVNFPPMRFNTGCYIDYTGGATGTIQWIVRGA